MARSADDPFAWIDGKIDIAQTQSECAKKRQSLSDLAQKNDKQHVVDAEISTRAPPLDLNYLFHEATTTRSEDTADKQQKCTETPMDLNYLFDQKNDPEPHIGDKLRSQIMKITQKLQFLGLRSSQYNKQNSVGNQQRSKVTFIQPPTHKPPPPTHKPPPPPMSN